MSKLVCLKHLLKHIFASILVLIIIFSVNAQENKSADGKAIYEQLKSFSLNGGKAEVTALVLKRDRVEMTFDGTIYFMSPIAGKVTGAVFVGQGKFRSEVPPNDFEKNNVKRLLNVDVIESDFKTAVLRFTDDTFDLIGKNKTDATAPEQIQKTASELDTRILRETGANISSRLALSILNNENPGFFFANFDGGKMGRFNFLMDYQNRVPNDNFNINAGEKGLLFKYDSFIQDNEIWTAFYSLEDYKNQKVSYADVNNLIDITNYQMSIDLLNPKNKLGLKTVISMDSRVSDLKAVTFQVGESLSNFRDYRLNKQMRVKSARSGTNNLEFVQEDWEGGFTVFLPQQIPKNQTIQLQFELDGDFMIPMDNIVNTYYLISNSSWYPRHGHLDKATFDLDFTHDKNSKIVCSGKRIFEEIIKNEKEIGVTKYTMKSPVAHLAFAVGRFERHFSTIKWENGNAPIPLEFNSISGANKIIDEKYFLAETNNTIRFFQSLFGDYPYQEFSGTFNPFPFGQSVATMIFLPVNATRYRDRFSFIAHETAHQWWGNVVTWRSYRDRWLSEGFAEYSGILYAAARDSDKSAKLLIDDLRNSLKEPPFTTNAIGKGRLTDVGPIILGHRLETSKSLEAYQTLIYNKGGLVLRMLHYLLTDPNNNDGTLFYTMMKDFADTHRNKVASTDDFEIIANKHFAKSKIAQIYGIKNLNWFFNQWVYQTELPTYKLEYSIENQPDGTFLVSGNVIQENAGDQWFMPLPVEFTFAGGKFSTGTVAALGAKTPFSIKLPMKPTKVELDPNKWVVSEKTSTVGS